MADIWELICHHTYTGIPGVIVDTSPPAASYGIARNLSDANFLADGVAPGSGAVSSPLRECLCSGDSFVLASH